MRKFVIHSGRDKTSIMEVECQMITAIEDPSVMWIPKGEYRARILKPNTFTEKDGRSLVWYSIAFYDTLEVAKEASATLVRSSFEFELNKHSISYTEEQVQTAIDAVDVAML